MAYKKRYRKRPMKPHVNKQLKKYVTSKISKSIDANTEDKHLLGSSGTITLNSGTPGQLTYLGGWARGVDWGQRIGHRIKVKYVTGRVMYSYTATSGTFDSNLLRILFVTDHQSNGTALVLSNDDQGIFPSTNFAVGDYPVSVINPVTSHTRKGGGVRDGPYYRINSDKTYKLHAFSTDNSDLVTGSRPQSIFGISSFRKSYPKGIYVNFNTLSNGNITDVEDIAHFLCVVTNITAAGHGTVSYRIKYDICYEDA